MKSCEIYTILQFRVENAIMGLTIGRRGTRMLHIRYQRSDCMIGISNYDSNSINTLFSGLSNGSRSSNSGLLGINIADYSAIRTGSYFKLMKAYYGGNDSASKIVETNKKTSTSTAKDDTKTLAKIEDAAEELKSASDALLDKTKKSVFNKVTTTDAKGNTTTDYDKDAIYKKVSAFVDSYNNLLKKSEDSNTNEILNAVSSMVRTTDSNEKLLSKVGITVGVDNKLSIDEETFKKADMSLVKSLFNGNGSYGYQVSAKASLADYYAEREASRGNTYGNKGTYTYNYNTGEIYNTTT